MTIDEIREALVGKYIRGPRVFKNSDKRGYYPIEKVSIYDDESYVVIHAPESNKWHFLSSDIEDLCKGLEVAGFSILERIDAYRGFFMDMLFIVGKHQGRFESVREYSKDFQYIFKAAWCDPLMLDVEQIRTLMEDGMVLLDNGDSVCVRDYRKTDVEGSVDAPSLVQKCWVGTEDMTGETTSIPTDVRELVGILGYTLDEEALKSKFKMLMDIELPTLIDMCEKGTMGDNALGILGQMLMIIRDSSMPSNDTYSRDVI